jgi:serine/threonine protein kinase
LLLLKNTVIKGERGEYRIDKRISEGGMGIVWIAKSTSDGKPVVVKEPHCKESEKRLAFERLRLESDVLRYLTDHSDADQQLMKTHLVRYVDAADSEGTPFLVLEYIDGPTLSTAFSQPWPETNCLMHVSTLLKVAMALHAHGIVHRDISPRNIFFNARRGLVLVDFGTSLVTRDIAGVKMPSKEVVIFKRGFSPPELLHGHSDERSDVFSIGAVMFFLLTGKNPADFMTSAQVLTKAACELDHHVSRQASGIVQAAMAPNPEARFTSPSEMLEAIEDLRNPVASGAKITFGRTSFAVTAPFTEIGREHDCDRACRSEGYSSSPHVRLADPRKYIEKHHARIWVLGDGRYMIEDLKSVNGTAIKSGSGQFTAIAPHERVEIQDKDTVALAYKPNRGPYVTFDFLN